eukprot:6901242-Ditylum_brightwellii.AAC.1
MKQILYYKLAQQCKLPLLTPPRVPQDAVGMAISAALKEQANIGWNNSVKGRISKKWAQAQSMYSKSFPKRKEFNSKQ